MGIWQQALGLLSAPKFLKMSSFTVRTLFLFSFAAVLFTGCTKEGPAGPQGEPGPAGPQGPSGPQGQAGTNGTANVFYSAWITIRLSATSEPAIFVQQINASNITADVVDKGVVLMYYQYADFIYPLPTKPLWFNYQAGRIMLYSENNSPNGGKVRFVIIPGSQRTGFAPRSNQLGINRESWQSLSYAQLSSQLQLPANGSNIQ